jgi:hypothetical protein
MSKPLSAIGSKRGTPGLNLSQKSTSILDIPNSILPSTRDESLRQASHLETKRGSNLVKKKDIVSTSQMVKVPFRSLKSKSMLHYINPMRTSISYFPEREAIEEDAMEILPSAAPTTSFSKGPVKGNGALLGKAFPENVNILYQGTVAIPRTIPHFNEMPLQVTKTISGSEMGQKLGMPSLFNGKPLVIDTQTQIANVTEQTNWKPRAGVATRSEGRRPRSMSTIVKVRGTTPEVDMFDLSSWVPIVSKHKVVKERPFINKLGWNDKNLNPITVKNDLNYFPQDMLPPTYEQALPVAQLLEKTTGYDVANTPGMESFIENPIQYMAQVNQFNHKVVEQILRFPGPLNYSDWAANARYAYDTTAMSSYANVKLQNKIEGKNVWDILSPDWRKDIRSQFLEEAKVANGSDLTQKQIEQTNKHAENFIATAEAFPIKAVYAAKDIFLNNNQIQDIFLCYRQKFLKTRKSLYVRNDTNGNQWTFHKDFLINK